MLVNNESTPKSCSALHASGVGALGWEQLDLESNLGFSGGLNAALDALSSCDLDRVLLLNNDTRLDPNAIRELNRFTALNRELKIIGLDILGSEDDARQTLAGYRYNSWLGFEIPIKSEFEADKRGFDYISGAAMLCDFAFLEQIGGIPNHSFLYFEELRLADALPSRAMLGYCVGARVYHAGGLTSATLISPSRHYFAALSCFRYTLECYWYKLPSVIAARIAWLSLKSILQRSPIPIKDGLRATVHMALRKTASVKQYLEQTGPRE